VIDYPAAQVAEVADEAAVSATTIAELQYGVAARATHSSRCLGSDACTGCGPPAQFEAGQVRTRGRRSPVPSSMTMSSGAVRPALSVMLIVSDADAAVTWYTMALGADRLWDLGGVAGLDLGGAPFFVHEAVPGKNRELSPTAAGMTTTRIEVFIDEPDELIERAAQAGATDVEPVSAHDTPWGPHRQGGFTDPFGHRWSVGDRTPLQRFPRSSSQ